MQRPVWEKKAKTAWKISMDCTEAYKEHIMYSFNGLYQNVFLSESENAELKKEYPDSLERLIEEMSRYIASSFLFPY